MECYKSYFVFLGFVFWIFKGNEVCISDLMVFLMGMLLCVGKDDKRIVYSV